MNNTPRVLILLSLALSFAAGACATLGKPEFKPSAQAYDRDFETVWKACLTAVENQPIESADKALRQITTKPTASSNVLANVERYSSIKISEHRPYEIRVMVSATRTVTSSGNRRVAGRSATDTFSDESAEKELLAKIDGLLR